MRKTKPVTAARTAGDLVRAGLAGLALLALLAAVPWGLITFVGNPLPDSVPDWSSFTSTVDATVIINVIAVVVWAVWAQFALCVAVELSAALSRVGRLPTQVPFGAVNQGLARQLVSALFLVSAGALTVGTASAAPASAATLDQAPRVTATAAAVPHKAASTPSAAPQQGAAPVLPTYVVKAPTGGQRDSLWRIAEQHLGDGTRWSEIQKLNEGRPQDDGGALGSDTRIRPGWRLLMPADAVGADLIRPSASTALQGTGQAGEHTVTVAEGDTLSGIAERELGDGDKYPQLLDASRDLVQPDGSHLSDPNVLFPGQKIVIPAPGGATTPPSAGQPAPATTPPPAAAAPQPVSPATPATPAPGPTASAPAASDSPTAAAAPSVSAEPSTAAPSAPAAAEQPGAGASSTTAASPTAAGHDDAQQQSSVFARQATAVGALLGAGLLATLATRRLMQFRRRRPGQSVAVEEETTRLETLLGRTAQPGSAALLDQALRTLAGAVPTDETLPELRAARVTATGLDVLPEDNTLVPVFPFTAGEGEWWTLDAKAELLDPDEAKRVPAPYPGLVTAGRDEAGNHILLNLFHTQVLLLTGAPANVRAVARSIALDAATCPWADHIEVVTAGFDREQSGLLAKGRIRVTPSAHAGIVDVAALRAEALQAEESGEVGPLPWLMVCTEDPGDHTWELAEVLSTTRGRHVAVVLPGDAPSVAKQFPDAEVLDADALTAQACDLAGTEVVLTRVTDEDHQQLAAALRVTVQEAAPASGVWEFVPDPDQVPPRFGPSSIPSPVAFGDHLPPDVLTGRGDRADDESDGTDVDEGVVEEHEDSEVRLPALDGLDDGTATPVALTKPGAPREVPVPPSADQPQLLVLGPISIANSQGSETAHPPRLAALAAFLYFRPGRDHGAIAYAMDPVSPWEARTLQTRIYELRGQLGHAPDGSLYLPRKAGDSYRLNPIHCDWTWFEFLAERGLPRGLEGLDDLEHALSLVRGRPFGTDGEHDWATPLAQEMVGRILDVAHTAACLRLQDGAFDLDAARHAIAIGLDVQEDEQLYRDWMRVEAAAGRRQSLFQVVDAAKHAMAKLDSDLQPATKRLISELLGQRA
ncbi:LysM peptidoglycan-binding domain-containing protein [Kitasatospora sp. NPDC088134]|uniref:LysM peptidoglycan-binding domain-containing protein n=1 Tax=Kitasatospora sp. NPDC088134 TaxID=3364071 RepID=UPI00380FD821